VTRVPAETRTLGGPTRHTIYRCLHDHSRDLSGSIIPFAAHLATATDGTRDWSDDPASEGNDR
jgi:hypothetical protein